MDPGPDPRLGPPAGQRDLRVRLLASRLRSGRHRSRPLVKITAAVAADLAALTEALDEPGADLATTLDQLATDAKLAVGSLVGLTVRLTVGGQQTQLSTLDGAAASGAVRASLLIPLQPVLVDAAATAAGIDLVLYAATRGAFTDLAADLAWLTGRALGEYVLDQHLAGLHATAPTDGLATLSLINQAIGVLIARGHTPEQAERELQARAARGGVDRHVAARQILAGADGAVPDAP